MLREGGVGLTSRSLLGRSVQLDFDLERTDRYGRALAYVWVRDALFNRTLVARGFAQVATYPPNVKYVDLFLKAQRKARSNDRGLRASCSSGTAATGAVAGGSSAGGSSAGGTSAGGNCDANYSGACIPPYPPDLDCEKVSAKGFRSTGSDPHGFDGDGDGIACES
jgi:micrococcal nuclease